MRTFFTLLLLFAPTTTFAAYQVFGVRTDFTMTDGETTYRDLYVNMGTDQGVKVGSQLDVFRSITVVDEINQKMGKNISFRIAKVKVIHADNDTSVARVMEMLPPNTTPTGTYTNVMVGDAVELGRK